MRGPKLSQFSSFFFFNDTATTEIYTLSLHDALPIFSLPVSRRRTDRHHVGRGAVRLATREFRSEEHTSELQSHVNLVCRLLLEKKKPRPACSLRVQSHRAPF